MPNRTLWVNAGIMGVIATLCYVLAITLPWPESRAGTVAALLMVSAWPILSIVYAYGLYDFVAFENQGTANRLSLVFAVAGFATVLAMIIVQLAVGAGVGEVTAALDEPSARALRRGLRLVDQGLDVAWDFLIGTSLVFSGLAIRRRRGLGVVWGTISAVLGAALIGLNAATFPEPPADAGLFDIGPVIGAFTIALAGRLTVLGRRWPRAET